MGEYLKENENKIQNIKNKKIYIYLTIFTITLIAERVLFKFLFNTSLQVFTSIYFICYLLFIWCINNHSKTITMFEKIGKEYSLDIYLWHILIIYIFRNIIIKYCGISINGFILPVIVIILSIVFGIIKSSIKTLKRRV